MPEKLNEKPIEYIKFLNQLGDKYKDVKLFDVLLEDSFVPKVIKRIKDDGIDYYKNFTAEEKNLGKFIYQTCGDEGHGYFMPDVPFIFSKIYDKAAKEKYKEFKKTSQIEQALELSSLLEKYEISILVKKLKKKQASC